MFRYFSDERTLVPVKFHSQSAKIFKQLHTEIVQLPSTNGDRFEVFRALCSIKYLLQIVPYVAHQWDIKRLGRHESTIQVWSLEYPPRLGKSRGKRQIADKRARAHQKTLAARLLVFSEVLAKPREKVHGAERISHRDSRDRKALRRRLRWWQHREEARLSSARRRRGPAHGTPALPWATSRHSAAFSRCHRCCHPLPPRAAPTRPTIGHHRRAGRTAGE